MDQKRTVSGLSRCHHSTMLGCLSNISSKYSVECSLLMVWFYGKVSLFAPSRSPCTTQHTHPDTSWLQLTPADDPAWPPALCIKLTLLAWLSDPSKGPRSPLPSNLFSPLPPLWAEPAHTELWTHQTAGQLWAFAHTVPSAWKAPSTSPRLTTCCLGSSFPSSRVHWRKNFSITPETPALTVRSSADLSWICAPSINPCKTLGDWQHNITPADVWVCLS